MKWRYLAWAVVAVVAVGFAAVMIPGSPVSLQNTVERLTARVGENQDCPPFVTHEPQRLHRARGLQFGCEGVFVFESPHALCQGLFPCRS